MTAKERKAKVYHADLWGPREEKYAWLSEHDWETTNWQKARPHSEFYLFVPRDEAALERYQKFIKATDIFPVSSTGVKTHRDHFVIDFDKEALKRRIRTFIDLNLPDDFVRETFGLKDSGTWSLENARKTVQQDKDWSSRIIPCLYRPFDVRWLFYHPSMVERSREEVMKNMLRKNLCLCSGRAGQVVGEDAPWNLTFCADSIQDHNMFYRGGVVSFPLYLYSDFSNHGFCGDGMVGGQERSNLNPMLLDSLQSACKGEFTPESIFYYVYAILSSKDYRGEYAELLRIDFPRIPFTKDVKLFQKLAALGGRLVDLHLLRSSELDPPIARFQGEGDNRVQIGKKGLRYDSEKQWVYINEAQFFEDVPPEVWEYQIGGYQVCRKWLKDRKGRTLSLDEIKTYCRIVTALEKTIEAQAKIDKLYPKVEETLLPIKL